MATAAIKSTAYCLSYTPELGLHHGTTPLLAAHDQNGSSFLTELPGLIPSYDETTRYAPNLTYIGALGLQELQGLHRPWHSNLAAGATRYGKYGEIMPEDESLGLLAFCDVFDIIWLERGFAESVKAKLGSHPVIPRDLVDQMKPGHDIDAIQSELANQGALPLYWEDRLVGCARRAHEADEALSARVLLENLACKAGGALALFHLLSRSGLAPADIDFVIECSEEAAGDINQRGGGSFAKAIAECAGCNQASGFDIRCFCSGPVNALITGASLVASGVRKNCVVLAGGALPKLFMNAREHVRKGLPALENCLGSFAVLLTPDDGQTPVLRLDALGKHSVGAGASPQAVVTALVSDPLEKAGLTFADVDKYAGELQIAEITVPAGAGDVAEANAKMIAALAVKKGQLDRSALGDFVAKHGVVGFAPTQGHIPSGIPFLGHAVDAIAVGELKRAMIIGKGSLFLARLTNLSDGASFLVEAPPSAPPAGVVIADGAQPKPQNRSVAGARAGAPGVRVGLMAGGSELGAKELLEGAVLAAQDKSIQVVAIGDRARGYDGLEWIDAPGGEADIISSMESALAGGFIDAAVALHYPFPLGVTTVGRLLTPGSGRPLLVASCTGLSASTRTEAMLRNAIYGVAVAKALGLVRPSVGVLNLDGSASVYRGLQRLRDGGYELELKGSRRDDGDLLRGNDLLSGATDVCVCDTLTGNAIMKLFGAFTNGGVAEVLGWGYGPSVGEDWATTVSIVSRASRASVIANAIWYTAAVVRGEISRQVKAELDAANAAGLQEVIAGLAAGSSTEKDIAAPTPVPTDCEICGIDVLLVEAAVQELWKAGIYAQPAMGCTGPVVRLPGDCVDRARRILSESSYL